MCATEVRAFLDAVIRFQQDLRDRIRSEILRESSEVLAGVAAEGGGDTIYHLDRRVDDVTLDACHAWSKRWPFVLVCEGLDAQGNLVFPEGRSEEEVDWQVIIDPIDGTRGLMYDKRSAWVLAGIAANRGTRTTLADIISAAQTEIPTSKQYLADVLWAVRGEDVSASRVNLLDDTSHPFRPRPSPSDNILHGFASLAKFFPGRKDVTAAVEEEIVASLGAHDAAGRVRVFDDQYISTGGQLYELMVGHDRWNGDIRAHLMQADGLDGTPPGIAAHPYDICTELIAREAGVVVRDPDGGPLRAPLDTVSSVSWVGYANEQLAAKIEPLLQRAMRARGLLP